VSVIDSYVCLANDFFLCFFVFRFSFYCLHVLCYSHCIVTSRDCRDVFCTHNNNNNNRYLVTPSTTAGIASAAAAGGGDHHDSDGNDGMQ